MVKRLLKIHQRSGGYPESEMVEDTVMLLASGGECVADIKVLSADGGLCRLLNRKFPSSDALFDFLYARNQRLRYVVLYFCRRFSSILLKFSQNKFCVFLHHEPRVPPVPLRFELFCLYKNIIFVDKVSTKN